MRDWKEDLALSKKAFRLIGRLYKYNGEEGILLASIDPSKIEFHIIDKMMVDHAIEALQGGLALKLHEEGYFPSGTEITSGELQQEDDSIIVVWATPTFFRNQPPIKRGNPDDWAECKSCLNERDQENLNSEGICKRCVELNACIEAMPDCKGCGDTLDPNKSRGLDGYCRTCFSAK